MIPDDNIALCVDQLTEFFRNVSRLLKVVDELMLEAGWESVGGSTCFKEASTSLQCPDRWMPRLIGRGYETNADPKETSDVIANKTRAFVSIYIPDRMDNRDTRMGNQCLITAGWFLYQHMRGPWDFWHCKAHRWALECTTDGVQSKGDPEQWKSMIKGEPPAVTTFALPIVRIDGRSSLESLVINPMLDVIGRHASRR